MSWVSVSHGYEALTERCVTVPSRMQRNAIILVYPTERSVIFTDCGNNYREIITGLVGNVGDTLIFSLYMSSVLVEYGVYMYRERVYKIYSI